MPTDWAWWAGIVGDESYALACECKSRDEAIREALRNAPDDEDCEIEIIEARSSNARKYESGDYDVIPFTHTRNHEIIGKRGPDAARTRSEGTTNAD